MSLFLLFLFKNPFAFTACYILTGITDVLDGYIARKFRLESVLGAKLDSLGDLFFYIVLTSYLIVEHNETIVPFLIPILLIFSIRIGNLTIGLLKFKKATLIHTMANKVTGLLVFALPAMLILNINEYLILTVLVALVASIEETIILIRSPKGEINLNQKSLFSK